MNKRTMRITDWLRRMMRRLVGDSWSLAAWRVLALLAALGIGGLLFVSAGLMPVAATDGHWPVTRVFLNFVMRRSVAAQTTGLEVPSLDDPAMVARGAAHYAAGCLPCHGGPGVPRSPLTRHMLPPPPELAGQPSELDAKEMFWVVKHGLKYTGMPGWLAQQRDDEVWAVVAFLQRLPMLGERRFQQLAYGELAMRKDKSGSVADFSELGALTPDFPVLATCIRCHGSNGDGRDEGAFPRLAGLSETYLRSSLEAYARGARPSGIMQLAVAGLDDRELDQLARYFAVQPVANRAANQPRTHGDAARGRQLAAHGDPARRIAACAACHGSQETNPAYPALAGQHETYLVAQLELFQQGQRGGTAHAPIMQRIAKPLTGQDIRDLAAYYATAR